MIKIDLHLHSAFSDGELSVPELVLSLKKCGVSVAALTDHDTTNGVELFLARCRSAAIKSMSGVEISAAYGGVLHITGYRFGLENKALQDALKKNRSARLDRNLRICERLRELGLDITLEEVRTYAGSDLIGRPHVALAMVNKGYVHSISSAFERYLKRGAAAYVPRLLLPPEDCIGVLRLAGGLPVLAHPLQTTPDLDDLPPVLRRLKDAGLWGMECWFPGASPSVVYRCLGLAREFELRPTAGSDFHGDRHAGKHVGVAVNEDLLPWAVLCGGL
ncbi:phosphatase [Synergistales bacterium]|nr:phosphatase [Synergistales bacterium]